MDARFSASVQTDPGAHAAFGIMLSRSVSPVVKPPGRDVDHPPPYRV